MKRQSGFTLIELVVVIVILGILAATAAPKFMNLQADARVSALNGLKASLKSGVSMVYSKAILAGLETKATGELCMDKAAGVSSTDCDKVYIAYGRPDASENGIVKIIQDEMCASTETDCDKDWTYKVDGTEVLIYSPKAPDSENCNLSYKAATASTPPSLITNDEGC